MVKKNYFEIVAIKLSNIKFTSLLILLIY